MVFAVVKDAAIRVVQPIFLRSEVKQRAVRLLIKRRRHDRRHGRCVGLRDLVNVDVPPRPALLINDLQPGFLADQLFSAPRVPGQCLIVRTRRGFDDFVIDDQIHARLSRMTATADEKADEFVSDRERRRNKRSLGDVRAVIAARVAAPLEAGYGFLVRQGSIGRAVAERRTGRRPARIPGLLKIGQYLVGGCESRSHPHQWQSRRE